MPSVESAAFVILSVFLAIAVVALIIAAALEL
jgi:hypothetical protein